MASWVNQEHGRVQPLQPYQLGLGKAFELLRDAVVVAEAGAGRIVFWNPAAELIFDYPADEAIGSPIEMLMPERMRELHRHGTGQVQPGRPRRLHRLPHSHRTARSPQGRRGACDRAHAHRAGRHAGAGPLRDGDHAGHHRANSAR